MREILKLLNDQSPGDLVDHNYDELHRLETLCENWRTLAEAERARRNALSRQTSSAD
jgi:hypothetical protein